MINRTNIETGRQFAKKNTATMGQLRKIFNRLLGPVFAITVLLTSIFGGYIITLFSPVLFLNQHRLWRSLMDRAISFWIIVPMVN